jgi:type IV pilus assembly protein PilV
VPIVAAEEVIAVNRISGNLAKQLRPAARGFTLIELLIAVVIVSVGVLGVASLQLATTAGNFEAGQRLQATLLANTAIDRMRTNSKPAQLDMYADGDLGGATIATEPAGCTVAMAEDACLIATAERDRWELEQLLDNAGNLVSPKLCITNNDGEIKVVVAWRGMADEQTTASADACGVNAIEAQYLRQVVINTYMTPANPY